MLWLVRMSMGLTNAGQTFQRFMNSIFSALPFVYVYIDDILVFSKSEPEHQAHLKEVFRRLTNSELILNASKCHFAQKEIQFWGHLISAGGISPLPSKCRRFSRLSFLRLFPNCAVFWE